MASPEPGIRLDVVGQVATITLCRPEVLNAQTPLLWAELRSYGERLPADVRVVVLKGQGRAFSAGLDVQAMSGGDMAGGPSLVAMAALSV
ncbi:MAG: enoyl-CoA hydratase/isomerase family protein, partial [Longispora sp.]|nr:enoyl-CoA hydratase/isomerase family protein [Longispora sp. (in: high G+C Gram-positive bacteria)]